jgi:hypothetical protein
MPDARPADFAHSPAASPAQRRALAQRGYADVPIPVAYLTAAQAHILLRRLDAGEPLWQPRPAPDAVLCTEAKTGPLRRQQIREERRGASE